MQLPELQTRARGWLPGTGAVHLDRLGHGLHYETYLAARDGRSYSLRVAARGIPPARGDADFEARVLAAAGRLALAPPLIYSDPDLGVLALAWLEGQPWSETSIPSAERIAQFAQLMRRVQDVAVARPWRSAGPLDWIEEYRRGLGVGFLEHLRIAADRCLETLARLPGVPRVICHSDLHRLNLLEMNTPPEHAATLLLDWEYVHMSDPLWDLAGWSANNDFSAEQARQLLTAYLGSAPEAPEWRRFGLLRWLFDYVGLLWTALYLTSVPRGSVPQLAERARLLETRLAGPVYGKLVCE